MCAVVWNYLKSVLCVQKNNVFLWSRDKFSTQQLALFVPGVVAIITIITPHRVSPSTIIVALGARAAM